MLILILIPCSQILFIRITRVQEVFSHRVSIKLTSVDPKYLPFKVQQIVNNNINRNDLCSIQQINNKILTIDRNQQTVYCGIVQLLR